MKDIEFLGNSLENIRMFCAEARDDIGFQLDRIQRGLEPNNWKPMNSIGAGVNEIRTKTTDSIYRTIYIAKFKGKIYVLHAFQKKTEKTAKSDIVLAKNRLKSIKENQ